MPWSSVRRRLSALSSFYRYCAAHDLIGRVPTDGVARPVVDPDYTATVGLDRDQARALVAAADADTGAQALRTAAVVRLLLHNALRVDERWDRNMSERCHGAFCYELRYSLNWRQRSMTTPRQRLMATALRSPLRPCSSLRFRCGGDDCLRLTGHTGSA